MIQLNINSQLLNKCGLKMPNIRKSLFEVNYKRDGGPYLQLHKIYGSMWVVTVDLNYNDHLEN